jgi:hypothetical protein
MAGRPIFKYREIVIEPAVNDFRVCFRANPSISPHSLSPNGGGVGESGCSFLEKG